MSFLCIVGQQPDVDSVHGVGRKGFHGHSIHVDKHVLSLYCMKLYPILYLQLINHVYA